MPILRLRKHQATFSEEDILIHPSDFSGLQINDVVELKPPKGGNASNRILLQVRKWPETNSYPNSVSIKDSVVNTHLQLYADVLVNIVDKKDVLVDSIEIYFSNAYLARSYMWGLWNYLNNRCVYQKQKLDYLHIRSQICEIWAQGNKVSSGYVDESTKIVFRSASSLVYLFIQMSSEMWDYDINGDLYCEKAINGFLTDLFDAWRKNDCSHDITIILFSRTFYDAESIEEFPKEMRECLQLDYKNRFYEDCYRVAFQNDRFDLHDWNAKLTTLKSLFNQYQKEVIDRHQDKYDVKIPRAYNSSASQGNFLEVLNMSLNVFEKHYFDRSFDRTGQLSVVVSPGVGVFEVDFEMTNLTKQRIIDNGIGSDLVCLGEQPLHTVPLLKFNSKSSQLNDNLATCDVYNMPHWINLSFYSSQNQVYYSNFIPRIKLPTFHNNRLSKNLSKCTVIDGQNELHITTNNVTYNNITGNTDSNNSILEEKDKDRGSYGRHNGALQSTNHTNMPDLIDYDEYDTQVFKPNPTINYNQSHHTFSRGDRSMVLSDIDNNSDGLTDCDEDFTEKDVRQRTSNIHRRSSDIKNYQEYSRNYKRQISENLPIKRQSRISTQNPPTFTRLSLVDNYLSDIKIKPESVDDLSVRGYNVQSSRINRAISRPKALINPFDPSHMTIKLTPNRRRWTHVFPQGPTGTFVQQHHYQQITQKNGSSYLGEVVQATIPEEEALQPKSSKSPDTRLVKRDSESLINVQMKGTGSEKYLNQSSKKTVSKSNLNSPTSSQVSSPNDSNTASTTNYNKSALVSNDTIRFAWCASGEQEWTPAITTGVDWKSLTMPACLPLTTDFFPSKTSLQNDYVIGEYNIDASCIHARYTLIDVYRELVCQRLQKGFQIILLPRQLTNHPINNSHNQKSSKHRSPKGTSGINYVENEHEKTEYTLSIGRIFHKLSLNGNTITVTQYRPRHPYPTIKIDYCYRFRAPFHDTYGQSWVHFKSEKLENYSWNYLDNYICARGESFELRTDLKFWRFRILILPSRLSLRKIPHKDEKRHDTHYLEYSDDERNSLMDSFVKLLEIINKTRRASALRTSMTATISSQNVQNSANQKHHHHHTHHSSHHNHNHHYVHHHHNHQHVHHQTSHSQHHHHNHHQSHHHNQHNLQLQQTTPVSPNRLNVYINNRPRGNEVVMRRSPTQESKSYQLNTIDGQEAKTKLRFETINMDIDSALRDAKRAEWVHVQYHCHYDIDQAFELVIKWMVASGAGIAEMVQGWSRKVGSSSVHVVPIPWEPFAMPHSGKADPLRCPIGIKLHLDCLNITVSDNQVVTFQEKILRRFGFITFYDLISTEGIERQFVHTSGFAFVALPNVVSGDADDSRSTATMSSHLSTNGSDAIDFIGASNKQRQPVLLTTTSKNAKSDQTSVASVSASGDHFRTNLTSSLRIMHQETISSPHEDYITRHIDGARQNKASRLRGENEKIEFIWSWNYMLTKRWRSPSTQHESYAVSLMQDFKDFCQNGSGRLIDFWNEVMIDPTTVTL